MIEIQNLTRYYGDFPAVDNISLNISKGEILGLLGPNGAGKTTTLRMLTGYLSPTSGTIRVKHFSIPEDTLGVKSLMGYLPESAPLYHNMLVFDYLDYVAKLKGMAGKEERLRRFKTLVRLCGLSGIMGKPIANLSKGLRQRVGLAHAMMTDPEILVLDEPTSGLDPNQIAEIRDILKGIGREKTIIFSTHILSEAEATCNRIAIINKGRIVTDDSAEALKGRALKNASIKLSLKNATEQEVVKLLGGIRPALEIKAVDPTGGNEVSFEIRGPDHEDPMEQIYLKIRETEWIITRFTRETLELENIFRKLTLEEGGRETD